MLSWDLDYCQRRWTPLVGHADLVAFHTQLERWHYIHEVRTVTDQYGSYPRLRLVMCQGWSPQSSLASHLRRGRTTDGSGNEFKRDKVLFKITFIVENIICHVFSYTSLMNFECSFWQTQSIRGGGHEVVTGCEQDGPNMHWLPHHEHWYRASRVRHKEQSARRLWEPNKPHLYTVTKRTKRQGIYLVSSTCRIIYQIKTN